MCSINDRRLNSQAQTQPVHKRITAHLGVVEVHLVALDLVQVEALLGKVALLVLEGAGQRHLPRDAHEGRPRVRGQVRGALGVEGRPVDGAVRRNEF